MVERRQAAPSEGFGEMSEILNRFRKFHKQNTRQIGRYFCIPASISSALQILGVDSFSQERIRDLWYAEQGKEIEPDINVQIQDFSLGSAIELLSCQQDFNTIGFDLFSRPADNDPFEFEKSKEALPFIDAHLKQNHPVIVSTWCLSINPDGNFVLNGHHMWLILDLSLEANECIYHDPWEDEIYKTPILELNEIITENGPIQFPDGLLGKITHSDYNCLALWRN
jgi:hypothetical protein